MGDSSWNIEYISPELRNKRKMSTIIASIQHWRGHNLCNKARKWNKRYKEEKENTFLLFTDDMVVCKENPKESKDNTINTLKIFFLVPT